MKIKSNIVSPMNLANQILGERIREIVRIQREQFGYSILDDLLDDMSAEELAGHIHECFINFE